MLVNAHILYKLRYSLTRGDKYFALREFREGVARVWGQNQVIDDDMNVEEDTKEESCSASYPHIPAILTEKEDRVRRKICKNKSRYCCIKCSKDAGKNVCLCPPQAYVPHGYSNSCWVKWHKNGQ